MNRFQTLFSVAALLMALPGLAAAATFADADSVRFDFEFNGLSECYDVDAAWTTNINLNDANTAGSCLLGSETMTIGEDYIELAGLTSAFAYQIHVETYITDANAPTLAFTAGGIASVDTDVISPVDTASRFDDGSDGSFFHLIFGVDALDDNDRIRINFEFAEITPPPGGEVPIPLSSALILTGLGGMVAAKRRRK